MGRAILTSPAHRSGSDAKVLDVMGRPQIVLAAALPQPYVRCPLRPGSIHPFRREPVVPLSPELLRTAAQVSGGLWRGPSPLDRARSDRDSWIRPHEWPRGHSTPRQTTSSGQMHLPGEPKLRCSHSVAMVCTDLRETYPVADRAPKSSTPEPVRTMSASHPHILLSNEQGIRLPYSVQCPPRLLRRRMARRRSAERILKRFWGRVREADRLGRDIEPAKGRSERAGLPILPSWRGALAGNAGARNGMARNTRPWGPKTASNARPRGKDEALSVEGGQGRTLVR